MTTSRRSCSVSCFLALLSLAGISACEFDEKTIAPGREQPVVHAVLDPFTGLEYEVLVERTLTGRVNVAAGPIDSLDPIVSGEGVPISGAKVEIYEIPASVSIGIEDATVRPDGKGRGVYRFKNVPKPIFGGGTGNERFLARGRRYFLRVTTPDGEVVTGATTIPLMQMVPDTLEARTFDREQDTYAFTWPAAEQAHRYAVVVQTPFGPAQLFTAQSSMELTGDLRNVGASRFPLVFLPGFLQDVQVFAVDTNYFDYYRSANDPFTGSGLLDHLDGGTGVFGSVVAIRTTRLDVVAPVDEPGEGTWAAVDDTTDSPTRLTLYFTDGQVSGTWADADEFPRRRGVLGTRSGSELTLRVLREQTDEAILLRLTATVVGDTLVTRDEAGVERLFARSSTR